MKNFISTLILLLSFLAFGRAEAATDLTQCKDAQGPIWCVLIRFDTTFNKPESEFWIVRTWAEYQKLFKRLVVWKPVDPDQPKPTPERDAQRKDLLDLGVNLKRLEEGKFVVLAAAVRNETTGTYLFDLGTPALSEDEREITIPVKVTSAGDWSQRKPQQLEGEAAVHPGKYWIVVTTPELLSTLGLTDLKGITKVQVKPSISEVVHVFQRLPAE